MRLIRPDPVTIHVRRRCRHDTRPLAQGDRSSRQLHWQSAGMLLAVFWLVASAGAAPGDGTGEQRDQKPPPIVYTPPNPNAPAARVGGGTRGTGSKWPDLNVLAPDHVGLTLKAAPILYWYQSRKADVTLEITVTATDEVEPVLQTSMKANEQEGICRIDLSKSRIVLQPDIQYQWGVALIIDPEARSKDILAGGVIKRVAGSAAMKKTLSAAEPDRRPFLLASQGIWYDALDALSRMIDAKPKDRALRLARASLLNQVKLDEVAEYDRQQLDQNE